MIIHISSYPIKKIGLLTMTLLALACTQNKRPDNLLSHDQMVKALAEIYIAEQKVNKLTLDTDSTQKVFDKMEGKIFDRIGIPDSVFKKSYDYYVDRPQEFEVIYTALIDTLNLYEQRLNVARPALENTK